MTGSDLKTVLRPYISCYTRNISVIHWLSAGRSRFNFWQWQRFFLFATVSKQLPEPTIRLHGAMLRHMDNYIYKEHGNNLSDVLLYTIGKIILKWNLRK